MYLKRDLGDCTYFCGGQIIFVAVMLFSKCFGSRKIEQRTTISPRNRASVFLAPTSHKYCLALFRAVSDSHHEVRARNP